MDPFSSDLPERFHAVRALEDTLKALRESLVDDLYDLVPKTEPSDRGFLLAIKRDCYNGRPLASHREEPAWPDLVRRLPLAEQVVDRENRLRELYEELEGDWAAHRHREAVHLAEVSHHPRLVHGLALASPILSRQLARRRHRLARSRDRKTTKLAESLLRYASRAALKLSPYATFTRVGLASLAADPESPGLSFAAGPWRERSSVRFKRYLVEQECEMLTRCAPLRERLPIRLNPTLEETAPRQYRWLRGDRWIVDDGKMRHRSLGLVTMELPPVLVSWFQEELRTGPKPHEALVRSFDSLTADGDGSGCAVVDRFLDLGVLEVLHPLATEHPHPEQALLDGLPDGAHGDLSSVAALLEELRDLQDGFGTSEAPDRTVQELHEIWDRLWQATRRLAAAGQVERHQPKRDDLYEDVFVEAGPDGVLGVATLSEATARDLLTSARPWYRLARLQGLRLELLHTLGAFVRRHAGPDGMPVLDLFAAFREPWREYRDAVARGASRYNPLELPEVSELSRSKSRLLARWPECLRLDEEGNQRISGPDLEDLLASEPSLADPWELGPCLFVQPADPEGRRWVLNRMFEGTGRYGSRFTPVMGPTARRRYTERLIAGSTVEIDGEPWELLDLACPHGDTLNVHAPQTRFVLELPGHPTHLPEKRRVPVSRLRVRVGHRGRPELIDVQGRKFLPVHLGGAASAFTPSLLQLLALLGPSETRPLPFAPPRRGHDGVETAERVLLDRLIVSRRSWRVVDLEPLRQLFEAPGARSFFELQAWRRDHGLPDRVFVLERVRHGSVDEMYKPQYLDLTSPSFVLLLSGIVQAGQSPLVFEEALPDPAGGLSADAAGRRWAAEVMLDAFVFHPGGSAASSPPKTPDLVKLSNAGEAM